MLHNNNNVKEFAYLLLAAFLLAGCISIPDSIKGNSHSPQQDLVRVMDAPKLYVGQEARFGGKVVKVTNFKDYTRLEIATQPLNNAASPIRSAASIGRIFADINGFIDPVDLNHQIITVVGEIRGIEESTIGQSVYHFLIIDVRGYHRWRQQQQVMMLPRPIIPWLWYPVHKGEGDYWEPSLL